MRNDSGNANGAMMVIRRLGFLICSAGLLAAMVFGSCSSDNPTRPDNIDNADSTAQADTVIDWTGTEVLYDSTLQEHNLSLLFIMVEWCSHCQNLKKYTLTDSSVIALINHSFNAVKIDADSREEVAYRDSTITCNQMAHMIYRVTGYPTIIVLDSGGNEIERKLGERGPATFVSELNQILDLR